MWGGLGGRAGQEGAGGRDGGDAGKGNGRCLQMNGSNLFAYMTFFINLIHIAYNFHLDFL